jgi:ubiquinone/menaquinone biosynthesis C-methylase UbiE
LQYRRLIELAQMHDKDKSLWTEACGSKNCDAAWPPWSCPDHGESLVEVEDSLRCPRGHEFVRVQGIPRFVEWSSYTKAFGVQWKRYRLTQLDSYTGQPISKARIKRAMGEKVWNRLKGKHVLECGCGAGRFTEVLLAQGARVTSIDLSEAVEANQESCPQNDAHRIAQADILRLPFKGRQFDVVFCLGVVQHTPNPEVTLAKLYEHVRPGGTLVIDHYTYCLSWYSKTAPLFRAYLRRLPPLKGLSRTEWIVNSPGDRGFYR